MKKVLSLTLVALLLLSLTACGFTRRGGVKTADGHILPPERKENAGRIWDLNPGFPVPLTDIETIATVRIGNWLGESDALSYYEATVLQRFRGDVEDQIVIVQRGSSKIIAPNLVPFTYGDEVLLLLDKSKDNRFRNEYWASTFDVCDVVTDGDGVQYAVNRNNSPHYYDNSFPIENLAYTAPETAKEVKRALERHNPELRSDQNKKRGVFRLSDMEPYLADTAGDNPYDFAPCSRDGVDQFLRAKNGVDYYKSKDTLYNITPQALQGTDLKLFKDGEYCTCYLYYGDEVFYLCVSGYPGLLSALPWDYDQNGVADLLYSASYGISVPDPDYPGARITQRQCYIALFDVTKKEKINLFCTNQTDAPQVDLVLVPSPEENTFEAWIADVTDGEHSAELGISLLRRYGTVRVPDGPSSFTITK